MAFILSERYPDKYHPRGKDILLISKHQSNHQNQSRKPRNLPAPTVPSHSTNNQVPTSVPNSHSQLAPTPFVPMPLHNQPFLPAGVRIPSEYTRPAALWTQPWPTGVATQQRPLPPHPTPQQLPTANYPVQPNYFNPHQQPAPPVSYPLTSPTYAQVASPYYYPAVGNTNNLSPHHTNQQILSYNSNMINQNNRQVTGQRALGGT